MSAGEATEAAGAAGSTTGVATGFTGAGTGISTTGEADGICDEASQKKDFTSFKPCFSYASAHYEQAAVDVATVLSPTWDLPLVCGLQIDGPMTLTASCLAARALARS